MTISTHAESRTTAQIIWDTMQELQQQHQVISRQRLMELTGLKYTLIDDHVSRWIEEGRLRRVLDGVYELPAPMPEPRAVSVTDLPDGMTVIELGDQELRLWPREARALGLRLAGNALQFSALQQQHDVSALLAEATVRNRALQDQISDLQRDLVKVARARSPQLNLLPTE